LIDSPHKITYRAHEFGAGDITNAVALLVAGFRWSSWTPPVYYTQILLSAFNCLSQSASTTGAKIWKAFIVGRVCLFFFYFSAVSFALKTLLFLS
jgi:mediator of RNA polymerase II transcription subunit 5